MEDLVVRLQKIFLGQFGCQFSFSADSDLALNEWNNEALNKAKAGTLNGTLTDREGRRMAYPIRARGRFAGLAIVGHIKGELDTRFNEMVDFAVSLLETNLASREVPNALLREEENLLLQKDQTNVVPFRPVSSFGIMDFYPTLPEKTNGLVSTLMVSKPGFPFQRLGLDVHVRSGRVAFLGINDLPAESLNSVEGLNELGELTVFIENIATVSMAQQEILAAYLRTQPSDELPVLLVGAQASIEDLIGSGLLNAELSRLLMTVRIPWNPQDNDSQAVKKAMHIILDGAEPSSTVDTHFVPFHGQYLDDDHPTFH